MPLGQISLWLIAATALFVIVRKVYSKPGCVNGRRKRVRRVHNGRFAKQLTSIGKVAFWSLVVLISGALLSILKFVYAHEDVVLSVLTGAVWLAVLLPLGCYYAYRAWKRHVVSKPTVSHDHLGPPDVPSPPKND